MGKSTASQTVYPIKLFHERKGTVMKIDRRTCIFQTNETDEKYARIKDEYKYESFIYNLLEEIDLDERRYKRLNEELLLIRLSGSFRILYISYLLTSKIRKDGRSYCLNCINNDLLVNYLLGISKVDPFDKQFLYALPYEPVLGIPEGPEKMFIQIWVSPDYRQTLIDYLFEICKEDRILFHRLNSYNGKTWISEGSYMMIPKGEDPDRYGDYYDDGTIRGFEEIYKDNSHDMIRISLLESERMNILDEGSRFLDDYEPSEAFDLLVDSCLAETNDHFICKDGTPYIYYGMTFWDFCLSVCKPHNSTRGGLGTTLLGCREDIWKMLERCNLTHEERYDLYKTISKHIDAVDGKTKEIIRQVYPYDCDVICRDIEDLYYIHPISASIEDVFNETRIAWIRNRKESE